MSVRQRFPEEEGIVSVVQEQGGKPTTSALWLRHCPRQPCAAIITLHGGRAEDCQASQPWHLAALRMRPVLRAAASAMPLDDLVLAHVRYRHRGWNQEDPLNDTYRALSELQQVAGPVPTVLIGHSMGGRAALRAASHPQVHGVLALAPWLPQNEPATQLSGKQTVVVHGGRDRMTSPRASADYIERARATGARAGIILVRNGDHAMLRRSRLWHRTVTTLVTDLLHPHRQPSDLTTASYTATDPLML
ncbi:dienelactone hydrolase family protein [Streptomyces sp. NPDC001914]|uniref:dienelactone hydrolase family protein n=1 Tax=Streptomyces sp. NPDC001914 TaxID=3364623 RepID=UPI00367F8CFE